jgi:hypothetical protein
MRKASIEEASVRKALIEDRKASIGKALAETFVRTEYLASGAFLEGDLRRRHWARFFTQKEPSRQELIAALERQVQATKLFGLPLL